MPDSRGCPRKKLDLGGFRHAHPELLVCPSYDVSPTLQILDPAFQ